MQPTWTIPCMSEMKVTVKIVSKQKKRLGVKIESEEVLNFLEKKLDQKTER